MRKFLYVLGALTLIIIAAAGVGFGTLFYEGRALDAESKAFVDSAVPAITATWDKQQLLDRATPELRRSVRPEELDALFNTLSQLGPLVKYEGATGEAAMSYIFGGGGAVSASYIAKARFQNGSATFQIVLMRRNGQWMIHNFHVDSAPNNKRVRARSETIYCSRSALQMQPNSTKSAPISSLPMPVFALLSV